MFSRDITILINDIDETRHYCGHASRQFKNFKKRCHTKYKEIIAVKYGIHKFKFHLSSYHFIVEIDNSSFPKVLEFNNKTIRAETPPQKEGLILPL